MSQLSFADFFNSLESNVKPDVPALVIPTEPRTIPAHRMMSIDTARKQFVSVFQRTARHLRRWDVFSDFITLAASELDLARVKTPENIERSRKICARYDAADIQNLHSLFGLMVMALEAKFHDFLGAIFMELELGSGDMGQYFTPYSVQSLMARMLMPGVKDTIHREGFCTISDPASGAAGMLVAYAECLLEEGFNPSVHMYGSCIDIDPIAADMAFIQLSLLGIAAEVVTGNSLTLAFSRVRYTPVYYLNNFEGKLASQRSINAMREIMKMMQEAA